jgi:hypothetical protein
MVGEHLLDPNSEVDAEVLSHPWIDAHHADNCLEAPHKTLERLETVAAAAEADHKRAPAVRKEWSWLGGAS